MAAGIRILLFVVVGAIVVVVGFLGWSIGLGWVLTHLIDFTLFEGSILTMLATFATIYLVRTFLAGPPSPAPYSLGADGEAIDDDLIPPQRFYSNERERTWENWFRFQTANNLNYDLLEGTTLENTMDAARIQELAIRLADTTVAILKTRPKNKRTYEITVEELKTQLANDGLQPYDDEILEVVVDSVNENLTLPVIRRIISQKRWKQKADLMEYLE